MLSQTEAMIALLQRVSSASVAVDDAVIAEINTGLLVFIGVERHDSEQQAERLAERLLSYRVFADAAGKMNCSLTDTGGDILLVPQFTLAADTNSGNRPGFSAAADPDSGQQLFTHLVETVRQRGQKASTGQFGADMQVSLCNEGPVTFSLRVPPAS
jgi:D-tyrosyl-tRNA(Tyr) deacylase